MPKILIVILLLAGVIAGYFLLQNPQIFKSRATNPPIVAKTTAGLPLTPDVSGIVQITDPALKLELTSPLGSARVSPAPSPSSSMSPLPSASPR